MKLDDLPRWALAAVSHKMRWFDAGDDPHAPPAILIEWDGVVAALVVCLAGREILPASLGTIRLGFDPSAVVVVTDGYFAVRPPGQMADEFHADIDAGRVTLAEIAARGGIERDEVSEIMLAQRYDVATGRTEFAVLPYRHDAARRRIEWERDGAGLSAGGDGGLRDLVHDALTSDFGEPYRAIMDADARALGLAPEAIKILKARGCLRALQAAKHIIVPFHPALADIPEDEPEPAEKKKKRPDPQTLRRNQR